MVRPRETPIDQLTPEVLQPGTQWFFAVFVLVAGWYGAKLVAELVRPQLTKQIPRVSVADTLLRVFRAVVMVIALFTVANILGYEPENVLLSVTVLTAAIAYIMAPIFGSTINGLFVLVNRPYEVGDLIKLVDTDQLGYVREITLRYTKIQTLDNATLVIPNDSIHRRDVVNFSENDQRSWLSAELTITYESDLETATELIERAGRKIDAVVDGGPEIRMGGRKYPAAPKAFVTEFGDRGVHLELRFWVFEPYHPKRVTSAVYKQIWRSLSETDISIAYPHTHHVFDETSGTPTVSLNGDSAAQNDRPQQSDSWADHQSPGE